MNNAVVTSRYAHAPDMKLYLVFLPWHLDDAAFWLPRRNGATVMPHDQAVAIATAATSIWEARKKSDLNHSTDVVFGVEEV